MDVKWPNGLAEIKEYFGDPGPHMVRGADGLRVADSWPEGILTYLPLPRP